MSEAVLVKFGFAKQSNLSFFKFPTANLGTERMPGHYFRTMLGSFCINEQQLEMVATRQIGNKASNCEPNLKESKAMRSYVFWMPTVDLYHLSDNVKIRQK